MDLEKVLWKLGDLKGTDTLFQSVVTPTEETLNRLQDVFEASSDWINGDGLGATDEAAVSLPDWSPACSLLLTIVSGLNPSLMGTIWHQIVGLNPT